MGIRLHISISINTVTPRHRDISSRPISNSMSLVRFRNRPSRCMEARRERGLHRHLHRGRHQMVAMVIAL